MSLASSSKRSSKGNIIINYDGLKSHKSDKSPLGSKRKEPQTKDSVKFEKVEEKLKKNLLKEFQTFNLISEQNESREVEKSGKRKVQESSSSKITHAEMTTQAKSPFMKSTVSSKAKLTGQVQDGGPLQMEKIKSSSKKQLQSTNKERSKNPIEKNQKTQKSSPQMRRINQKNSNEHRQAFSKMPSEMKEQNRSRKGSMTKSKDYPKQEKLNKGKNNQKTQEKQQEGVGENLHLTFPQMITESQSAYPSSSYPNTGKESNSNMKKHRDNESEGIEEDFIDEDQIRNDLEENEQKESEVYETQQNNQMQIQSGYKQLPNSYILAMQILQRQLLQQQQTIKNLQKKLKQSKTLETSLNDTISTLREQLQKKDETIKQRQQEVKFLKGYLDEEKSNNREALKQVARNVYERSVEKLGGKSKDKGKENRSGKKSVEKQGLRRKLQFENENGQRSQIQAKIDQDQNDEDEENDKIQEIQKPHKNPANKSLRHSKSPNPSRLSQTPKKTQSNLKNPITTNLLLQTHLTQKLINQQLIKQQLLKNQLLRQQIIKDDIVRQEILREEHERKRRSLNNSVFYDDMNRLRYNYLDGSVQSKLVRNYSRDKVLQDKQPKTDQKIGSGLGQRQPSLTKYGNTDHKRIRSMSTAQHNRSINPPKQNPNITYRQQQPLVPQGAFSIVSQNPGPSTQSIIDPIFERYIHSKCQLSPDHKHSNNLTPSNISLRSQAAKQSISQMRELMRHEKELIALNYKLQVIEKKILKCVKSNKSQQEILGRQNETQNKIRLQELQNTYRLLKKQFEKKQLTVREIKRTLQHE